MNTKPKMIHETYITSLRSGKVEYGFTIKREDDANSVFDLKLGEVAAEFQSQIDAAFENASWAAEAICDCYNGGDRTIELLREAGYAVTIFNPSELGEVSREDVESRMVEAGNEYIGDNAPTYRVVKKYSGFTEDEEIETGLTLLEAREICSADDTSGKTASGELWMYCFYRE